MKRIQLALCAIAIALAGCGVTAARIDDSGITTTEMQPRSEMPQQQPVPRLDSDKLVEAALEPAELRIQREGKVRVDAPDPQAAATRLRRMIPELDGVLMHFKTRSVSFKMPSSKLESLLQKIENMPGCEIDELDFSAFDRSAEYYGLKPRHEASVAIRDRLLKLIPEAPNAHELSSLKAQLEQIQTELDRSETQLRDIALKAGRVDVTVTFD